MCTYRQLHENCIQCQPKNSHQQAKHNSLFDLHQVWIQSRVGCSSASTFLCKNPSTHFQSSYHQQKATRALCLVLCHRGSSSLKILQRTLKCCPILGTSHRRNPSVQIRVGHAYAKYADYAYMRNMRMRMRIENLTHIFHIQREKTSLFKRQ